ncbi:RelA/SpoT domain-containing protein [Burkholderia contaminans]|nr:RelA/SpoT domain-containing protein [Burkholderia contaminans]
MTIQPDIDASLAAFDDRVHELSIFMSGIGNWFSTHPRLNGVTPPVVHSVKTRMKNRDHLKDKIARKSTPDDPICPDNLFVKITDLAGVRVLHLYQEQAQAIHGEIMKKVNEKRDWYLHEDPKAYTWDPESQKFFEKMGIQVHVKDSFYTSLHYLVRPRADSPLCCEIQVRTLFEEIWGEVDHSLNYPTPTDNVPCREQLRVLAKVVGAGSRLVDSIFRSASSDDGKAR